MTAWNYSTPFLRLNSISPSRAVLHVFPESVARKFSTVPLSIENNGLTLASPFNLSEEEQNEIQTLLRRPIKVMACSWVDYQYLRDRLYGPPGIALSEGVAGKLFPTEKSARDLLELNGLLANLPHLAGANPFPPRGLDYLLPAGLPRDHVIPLGWAGSTLFLLTDDPRWQKELDLLTLDAHYSFQWIIAEEDLINLAYQRLVLRGHSLVTRPSAEMIDLLVAERLITREQGDLVLQVERQVALPARQILFERNLVSPDAWLKVYSRSIGVMPLLARDIPPYFAKFVAPVSHHLPGWMAQKFHLLPIAEEDGTLLLGVDTLDLRLLDLVSALTHLQVEPRLMDEQELQRWLDVIYPPADVSSDPTSLLFLEVLIQLGYITRAQFDETNKQSANWVGELMEKGFLSEEDLVEATGFWLGMPTLSLDHVLVDEKLLQKIPEEAIQKYKLFPLLEDEHNLWVASADPFLAEGFKQFETLSKKSIWPVLAPYSIIVQMIERTFSASLEVDQAEQTGKLLDQLVAAGLCTRKQAYASQKRVKETGVSLDEAVVAVTGLSATLVGQKMAKLLNVKFEELALKEERGQVIDALGAERTRTRTLDPVDPAVARLLTLESAHQFKALPIRQVGDQTVVAFSDPLFENARRNLQVILRTSVIPVLTTHASLEDAIQRTLGRPNLGTTLLVAGMITRSQLNDALDYARRVNIRLGKALVFKRYITETALYQFLAHQADLPFFDLSRALVDKAAVRLLDPTFERTQGVLPLAQDAKQVILATVDPLNQEGIQQAEKLLNKSIKLVLISESDLEKVLEEVYRSHYLNESISSLLERTPQDSAYRVLVRGQVISLIVMAVLTVVWLVLDWHSYLVIINALVTAFYLVFSIYKFRLIFKAISTNLEVPVTAEEVAQLKDADLPVYTILVPVHREAEVLPEILKSLASIDYPSARLDILVLMEEEDEETIARFDQVNPPRFIQKVIVPNELPKTKPKACNYGLIHARGDYVVIYDAEDLPDRDQLKRVVIAFNKTDEKVACIQAKLNYYNRNQNILTRWFTVEYSMWFDLLLPGLDAEHAPIPLGGTSNHFRTLALVEAGAWDPYNVTEDADLGIRLFKRGYRTRIVDSTTYEEANSQFGNWIRQRSRWLKGYMQTWLVHMRRPLHLIREIGFWNFMSFQFIVGGTFFTALMNPVYWAMTAIWFLAKPAFIQQLFPGVIFYMGALCLYVGTFVFTYVNVAGAMRRGYYGMVSTALLSPIYWAMSSIASWKGFVQLIVKPHFWEKTRHGLYQRSADDVDPGANEFGTSEGTEPGKGGSK
ncbi:MAG: glycosyltransferase [Anaerolineaceae bacterium]|nr:glycosyltransferase [Anaerolineaceae bacterium]